MGRCARKKWKAMRNRALAPETNNDKQVFFISKYQRNRFFQKNIRITFDLITQSVLPFLKPCSPLVNDQAYHQVEVPQWEELLTGEAKTKIRLLRIQIPQTRGDNEP